MKRQSYKEKTPSISYGIIGEYTTDIIVKCKDEKRLIVRIGELEEKIEELDIRFSGNASYQLRESPFFDKEKIMNNLGILEFLVDEYCNADRRLPKDEKKYYLEKIVLEIVKVLYKTVKDERLARDLRYAYYISGIYNLETTFDKNIGCSFRKQPNKRYTREYPMII